MKLFTNTEAKACTMMRCDFIKDKWVVGVLDNNKIYYEVTLVADDKDDAAEELSISASKNEIQNATIAALKTRIKQDPPSPVIAKNEDDDMGIGNSLG